MERDRLLNSPIINEIGIWILRVFVGFALLIKGGYFLFNMQELQSITITNMQFWNFITAHYVVFAHIVGGFCLLVGLLTRLASIINIPILLGAIIFVHAKEGIFNANAGLELTALLLVTLCVLALTGSRFLAVDNFFSTKIKSDEKVLSMDKIKHAA